VNTVEKTRNLPLPGIKPRPSSPKSVAIPTDLSQLITHMGETRKHIKFSMEYFKKRNHFGSIAWRITLK
jgi:hypothetical protein